MALPPAAAPTPAASPVPPPAMAAPAAPADDMAGEEPTEEGEPEVVATILKNSDGTYTLQAGDEPEDETGAPMGEPTGDTFDTPQALVRGLIGLLEGGSGAEEAFGEGFKGGRGADMGGAPAGPKPPMGM